MDGLVLISPSYLGIGLVMVRDQCQLGVGVIFVSRYATVTWVVPVT